MEKYFLNEITIQVFNALTELVVIVFFLKIPASYQICQRSTTINLGILYNYK